MKGRYVILFFSFAWFIVTCIFAPQMGPQTEEVKFIADDHPIWEPFGVMLTNFEFSNANKPDINFFWGAASIDKKQVNKWDPDDIGELVWNDEFDPSSEEAQKFMLNFCVELEKQEIVSSDSMICWVKYFN